jgi:hypothetical protein
MRWQPLARVRGCHAHACVGMVRAVLGGLLASAFLLALAGCGDSSAPKPSQSSATRPVDTTTHAKTPRPDPG